MNYDALRNHLRESVEKDKKFEEELKSRGFQPKFIFIDGKLHFVYVKETSFNDEDGLFENFDRGDI